MKTLIFIYLLLLSFSGLAKTVIIDPLANLVSYSLTTDRTNNHFEQNAYNPELSSLWEAGSDVIFLNEFSGLGTLKLENYPRAQYFKPNSNGIDKILLSFNQWGWVSQQDFFFTLDSASLNFFTMHPFFKKEKLQEIIKKLSEREEILIITTTWPSGEALYKSVLTGRKNVSYLVRDLHLKKTMYKTNEMYKFIKSQENTQYFIYDNNQTCLEVFNLAAQAKMITSQDIHVKTDAFIERISVIEQNVKERIQQYRKSIGCDKP